MFARRDVLRLGGALAGATALAGCDGFWGGVSRALGGDLPDHVEIPQGASIDPARHLLDRAAFGPWPGDVERVRAMGEEAWIDEQLAPQSIDDTACSVRTARIDTIHVSARAAFEWRPEVIEEQLVAYTLLQAIYSRRQLNEVMVSFWSDHFNIAIGKSLCRELKTSDDRDVIRAGALGSFRDLLGASARSAAMLVYLDGRANRKDAPPNENYARELLELHTLGVGGGYTQADVMEAARCLTGWTVRDIREGGAGSVEFKADRHDDGEKRVLGESIPAGGGERDLDRLLDIVARHPSCGAFIAKKLCRFFIEDEPSPGVVSEIATVFRRENGSIAKVVRAILTSEAFRASVGKKLKRPFRFVVSSLRALGAETAGRKGLSSALARMGQAPFQHPTPEGYPDRAEPWMGTLLFRWSFALALAEGRLEGVSVDLPRLLHALGVAPGADKVDPVARHLLGRSPDPSESSALRAYLASEEGQSHPEGAVALLLSSPAYQWC
jgi:uncharacterized protein (DUF1800 family)